MQFSPSGSGATPPAWSLVLRARGFVRGYRRAIAGIILLATLLALASAIEPLVMRHLFDGLAQPDGERTLLGVLGALLALEVGSAAVNAWLNGVTWDVRLGLDLAVRERVVRKLTRLPMSYHQHVSVGGTMTTVNQALQGFVDAFGEVAFKLLPTVVYFVLSLVAMWDMHAGLSVLVLAFAPVPAIVGAWASREQTDRQRRLLAHWTRVYSRLSEVLGSIRAVKAFGREEAETQRFLGGQREGNDIVRQGARTDARMDAVRGFGATLARLVVLAVGGLAVAHGELTLGTLVAFLGYINGFFGPVQGLTTTYQTLRRATVSLEHIFEILDADEVVADVPGAVAVEEVRGEVRFENLSFAYQQGTPVLRDVSLHVRPGEVVALVGPSGSGKTSLVSLLQRLYHPTGGRITVDGMDIRLMQRESLMRQIGVVFQDAVLFQDTVRANIAYGRPDASDDEIEAAARAANAHDFILSLPDGYDTNVGERGSCLSGGQRQRIAIARALLVNPPILIFDEATSALDAESEALVQEALRILSKGRTTFVIAHRLSTVVDADRIVVLRDGRIAEMGDHATLMEANGFYASLVDRQTGKLELVRAA
ncbi:MAG TPA: ABC transporter ATP-binding protein [Gemmatimonadaceae bacterium]|nr:ABC transporter ATP-binding protein [Gemmatimonadaceae bacterium]